jgi:hypothetical protein
MILAKGYLWFLSQILLVTQYQGLFSLAHLWLLWQPILLAEWLAWAVKAEIYKAAVYQVKQACTVTQRLAWVATAGLALLVPMLRAMAAALKVAAVSLLTAAW